MSRLAARRKKWLKLLRPIIWLFNQWGVFINMLMQLQFIKDIIKYLKSRKLAWGVLVAMLIFFLIVLAGILPSDNNFEGSLVVKQIGFIYNDQKPDKLFINNINGIKKLLVDGRQTLILTGQFSSSSHPELNQKLTQRNTLKIELPSDNSQWMIAPADSKLESNLKLTELRLQPQTTIDSLTGV